MSNARDKANIPALNFSSTGIDDNATSTAVTIDSSGDVGINNTAPNLNPWNKAVTLSGTSNCAYELAKGSTLHGALGLQGDNRLQLINFQNADITFNTGTSATERMRITSAGNVGIGTSAPSAKLQVTTASSGVTPSASADELFLENSVTAGLTIGSGTSSSGTIYFGDSGDNNAGRFEYYHGDDSMRIFTFGSEAMRITSAGSVGIGTSSPSSNLHIFTDASGEGILVKSTGNTYNDIIGDANRSGAGNNLVRFRGNWNGNSVAMIAISAGDDTTNKDDGRLEFFTSASGSSQNKRMVIEPNGNVGIGTSSPSEKLDVDGNINLTDSLLIDGAIKFEAVKSSSTGQDSIYKTATNTLAFNTGGTERMRIDSSGKVGIGETSMDALLVIKGDSDESTTPSIRLKDGSDSREAWITNNAGDLILTTGGNDNVPHTQLKMLNGNLMTFRTADTERMRIDSSGNVLIGKTSQSTSTNGYQLLANGGELCVGRSSDRVALFNRNTNDGQIVLFLQNGTFEGDITVSGTTVSYNGFTGTHWSRFTDNSTPTILRGTVLETLDEMCDWYNLEFDVINQDEDGNDISSPQKIPHVLADGQSEGDVITYNHEGTDYQATIVKEGDIKHMKSKVSDTVDAKNVYGVFSAYDLDGEGYNDFYVASVGSFVVRIKANETIAKGDLLQSNGDGTAKVQTDDNVKSSSFAKVLSTTIIETYEDGSYLVPCSLMC